MSHSKYEIQAKIDEANKASVEAMAKLHKDEFKKQMEEYIVNQKAKYGYKYAAEMDALRSKHKTGRKGQDGKEATYADELNEHCDRALNDEVTANHDWRSCMMSLVKMCGKLNKVLAISTEQTLGEAWDRTGHQWLVTPAKEKGFLPMKSWFMNKINELSHNDVDLPSLQHNVSFKDGKVNIQELTRADGVPFFPKLPSSPEFPDGAPNPESVKINRAFKALVTIWLAENNYELDARPDAEPEVYTHKMSGAVLDEVAFKKLKESPEKGLGAFLEKHADLEYEELPQVSPVMY